MRCWFAPVLVALVMVTGGCDDEADPEPGDLDAAPDAAADACEGPADCADDERCVGGRCRPSETCDCPAVEAPVCGVDGETYANACEAMCAEVAVARDGACEDCACSEIADPVCGVDGVTYDNACFADCAGVEVARAGRCERVPCGGETLCPGDAWCDHPEGCGASVDGVCEPRPDACPEVIEPVCGCDGVTYGNACEAHAAGVGVAVAEPCDSGCDCPLLVDPVCGDDGMTYDNACLAACAEVAVAYPGECAPSCGGFGGGDCGDDGWCDFPGGCGFDDGSGVCQQRPAACDEVYEPVCGCDGETYGNACAANAAGVDVQFERACDECAPEACGPAPGAPVVECEDGSQGGPTGRCVRDMNGICGWEIRACPEEPVACGARLGDTCDPDEYCDFDGQFCDFADATGLCRPRPEDCPDVIAPVCGCDGVQYDNACRAHAAGVDYSVPGPCEPVDPPDCADGDCGPPPGLPVSECADGSMAGPTGRCLRGDDGMCAWEIAVCPPAPGDDCDDNGDCAPGDFCRPPAGLCRIGGVCAPRPDDCFLVLDPVCGCDDRTYDNACAAEAAGVPVASAGECPRLGLCLDGEDCAADEYCAREPGGCGFPGECVARPIEQCPDLPGRVCGCDGVTYESACHAAQAGASVDALMACAGDDPGCAGNADCGAGQFCARAACDGPGECAMRPGACAQIYDPVCGCDGMTYGNACSAASAGVSVARAGECAPR